VHLPAHRLDGEKTELRLRVTARKVSSGILGDTYDRGVNVKDADGYGDAVLPGNGVGEMVRLIRRPELERVAAFSVPDIGRKPISRGRVRIAYSRPQLGG